MSERDTQEFERQVVSALERSELDIHPDRLQRLQQARREAVAAAEAAGPVATRVAWWWLPTGAAAAVALTVGLMLSGNDQPVPLLLDPAEMSAAQDLELLTDLEFMAWMLEQEQMDGTIHAG